MADPTTTAPSLPRPLSARDGAAQPDVPPRDEKARDAYGRVVRALCEAAPAATEEDGSPRPHRLGLDSEALDILYAWEAEVERELGDGGAYAVRLMRALATHALHVLGGLGIDRRNALAQYVLGRAQELPEGSTLRDLWQATKRKSEIETMEDLREVVDELEERGCIRLRHARRDGPGRPPSPTIEIHPSLRKSTDNPP